MGSVPTTMAPERQAQTDDAVVQSGSRDVGPLAEPASVDQTMSAEEYIEPKSPLPLLLIGTGIAIYFIAIAAFASFPGVAIGICVILLGGIIYTCRGFAPPRHAGAEISDSPVCTDDIPDTLPSAISMHVEMNYARPEPPVEPEAETAEVLVLH